MIRARRHQQVAITLATTGQLLELYQFKGARLIEITSEETSGSEYVYLATGITADGGALPANARPIPCSSLPVEIDVYGQGDGIALYGSSAIDIVAVVR